MIGRRILAAGVVAGAVAVGGVAGALIGIPGLSSASSSSTTSDTTGATGATGTTGPDGGRHFHGFFGIRAGADRGVIDAAAKALNLTTEQLLGKLSDGKTTIADVAEQQHVDLQTVTDAMEAVAKRDIQNLVNNPLPMPPKGFPDFPGGGPQMHDGFGFVFGLPGVKDALDPVAKALGITTDELQTDLRNGQSIADIAKAKNVDLNTIVDELVKEAQSRFDDAVSKGKLTQDQADRFEARLKERITDLLNRGLPKGLGDFGAHFRGGPGRFRGGAPWPGGADAPSPMPATAS